MALSVTVEIWTLREGSRDLFHKQISWWDTLHPLRIPGLHPDFYEGYEEEEEEEEEESEETEESGADESGDGPKSLLAIKTPVSVKRAIEAQLEAETAAGPR